MSHALYRCLLDIDAPYVGAEAIERTTSAFRTLSMTDLPPMGDKVNMQRIDPLWRKDSGKEGVRRLNTYFGSQ